MDPVLMILLATISFITAVLFIFIKHVLYPIYTAYPNLTACLEDCLRNHQLNTLQADITRVEQYERLHKALLEYIGLSPIPHPQPSITNTSSPHADLSHIDMAHSTNSLDLSE